MGRILIPLYRERPPAATRENYAKIRKMRLAVTGVILFPLLAMVFLGVPLVGLLYDPRFAPAGAVVVAVSCILVPQAIILTYDQAALAAGDSQRFFYLSAAKAAAQIVFLLVGMEMAGLVGALVGQGLATLLVYPVTVWLARRHGVWDPLHDVSYGLLGAVLCGLALWFNWEAIERLGAMG